MDVETIGDEDKSAGMGVQVIARAASVLRALEGKPDGLSLAQIAREVGLARSTVQRIVAALAAEDFVSRSATRSRRSHRRGSREDRSIDQLKLDGYPSSPSRRLA